MVRKHDGEIVTLSVGDKVAIAGLVLAIVGTLVGGSWWIGETNSELRSELRHVRELYSDLKTRIERVESIVSRRLE